MEGGHRRSVSPHSGEAGPAAAPLVTWLEEAGPVAAGHHCLPFGCTGSVYAWDRIGALLCHLARKVLDLAVLRYVDDFFCAARRGEAQRSMQFFARLVRVLLGPSAVSERKLAAGNPLEVLGVIAGIEASEIVFFPSPDKVIAWLAVLEHALETGRMHPGEAGKMAGRLCWASSHLFRRMGRAMLRPLYKKAHGVGSAIGPELRRALLWWCVVLKEHIAQPVPMNKLPDKVLNLFCDARGVPPRTAAVLIDGDQVWYTDARPPKAAMRMFLERQDEQIMGLELLAVAMALHTFAGMLKGTTVRVWTDNASAWGALAKGAAGQSDHNCLVHGVWLLAWRIDFGLWVEWVPTDRNVADLPSRQEYGLLEQLGATRVKAVFPCVGQGSADGLQESDVMHELAVEAGRRSRA